MGANRGAGEGNNELWIQRADGSFVDRAEAWGVADPLGRGRRPLLYDHNGDGRLDLYITNAKDPDGSHPGNRLYINTGNQSFRERVTAATGDRGYRCVANADLDADGRQDLIVCSSGGVLHIFKNKGFGHRDVSFLTREPIRRPRDVQAADLNTDGLTDLTIVLADRVEVRLNRGSGYRFSRVSKTVPLLDGQRALVRDMTGDGKADVYVVDGCSSTGENAPDRLLVAPTWDPLTPPGDPSGGCGNEVVDAGRLVVFNGDEALVGPVTVREYPLITPDLGPGPSPSPAAEPGLPVPSPGPGLPAPSSQAPGLGPGSSPERRPTARLKRIRPVRLGHRTRIRGVARDESGRDRARLRFGDGNSRKVHVNRRGRFETRHRYRWPGRFKVRLKVVGVAGKRDTAKRTARVRPSK